jgi:hypothetical protein
VTSVAIPGEGTYTADQTVGTITFTPASGFTGQLQFQPYSIQDAAGNWIDGGVQVTVTVEGAAQQLKDLQTAVQGTTGPGTSLSDKVSVTEAYLAAGDTAEACGTLGAMINEIQAQSGGSIPAGEASSLVAEVRQIELAIGC